VCPEKRGNSTGEIWRALSDVLPLLAEAAPTVFLEAVHESLDQQPSGLSNLFRDRETTSWLGSSSPHTHLLWALEGLCWHDDYLLEAVRALARLDVLDQPRGRLSNRPHRSLASVLVPWVRHTSATLQTRKDAIDVVCRESETEVVRDLVEL
jgi:hypothetical protein